MVDSNVPVATLIVLVIVASLNKNPGVVDSLTNPSISTSAEVGKFSVVLTSPNASVARLNSTGEPPDSVRNMRAFCKSAAVTASLTINLVVTGKFNVMLGPVLVVNVVLTRFNVTAPPDVLINSVIGQSVSV